MQTPSPEKVREGMGSTMRALVLASVLAFSQTIKAEASGVDRELSDLVKLGPACTALLGDTGGSGAIAACKVEFRAQSDGIAAFIAAGKDKEMALFQKKPSELCRLALPVIREQRTKVEALYHALQVPIEKLDVLEKDVQGCTWWFQTKINMGMAFAHGKLEEKLLPLLSQLQADISYDPTQAENDEVRVERMKKATVAFMSLLSLMEQAAEEGLK